MAVTISNIVTNFDSYIGDASTDRVSQAERFQYITESTAWLLEELGNEHMVDTYQINFVDGISRYKITSSIADLLVGADLRRPEELHTRSFIRKSPRELAEEIGNKEVTRSWAIDRYDGDAYLVINHRTESLSSQLATFDSLTSDWGGTWTADTTNSDATNLTADSIEFKQGSGALNFDVDVSQSGNNRATVYNAFSTTTDLSEYEDLGSFVLKVYIPENTYTSSYTLYWSSDTSATPSTISNYWSATVTTDYNGNALADGWNTLKINWADATATGTPDASEISYLQVTLNYTGSQVDDTDYRLDDLYIARPEKLTFHYISAYIGVNNSGTDINAFTATTDVPFYSGVYDQYKYVVAHKAASLALYALRLREEGINEERLAIENLDRYRKNFESSKTREEKNFKVLGINFRNRRARFNRR
jgi:hypothetical protein